MAKRQKPKKTTTFVRKFHLIKLSRLRNTFGVQRTPHYYDLENFEPEVLCDSYTAYNAPIPNRFDTSLYGLQALPANQFVSKAQIIGQILEIRPEKVVMNCLIDEDKQSFQVRRFDRELLEDAVLLRVGGFVEINIYSKPGERKFTFQALRQKTKSQLFAQEHNIFSELLNSSIFDPLPSTNDDQL